MPSGRNGKQPVDRSNSVAAAFRHHRRKDYAKARQACLGAWQRGTGDVRVAYLMACLEARADNLERAASWFRHAARHDPEAEAEPHTPEDGVSPALSEILVQDSHPVRICRDISIRLHDRGADRAALLALKAWLAYAPGHVKAMEVMGEVAGRMGDHPLAAAVIGRALRLSPGRADLALKLGNALNRQGEPHQALASYQQATRLDQTLCEARINIGLTLQQLGRMSEAEAILQQTVAMHPGHAGVWYAYARILLEAGRTEEALRHFEKTVAIAPDHASAWLDQAHAWKRMGLIRKAAAAYREAARLVPDSAEIHFALGTTLHGLGDFAQAEAALSRAVALAPDHPSARFLLDAVQGNAVGHAPRAYVEGLFDRYATAFDRHMKGLLHYRIPAMMRRRLKPIIKKRGPFNHLLDIGCGTGLAGETLRAYARRMTGVDVARRILARARDKQIYDHLVHDDFQHYLAATDETFDLVVAADVFIYTGNLEGALKLIDERLALDGRLIFSTERCGGSAFRLQASGRFAHSRDYIVGLARTHGFRVEAVRPVPVRMERKRWIDGDLYILAAVNDN